MDVPPRYAARLATLVFNGVKRELKKLKLIPDWLWCEIQDECIVLPIRGEYHAIVQDEDEMEAEPSRRTNASI